MRSTTLVLLAGALIASTSPVAAQDPSQPNLCLLVEGSAPATDDVELLTEQIAAGDVTVLEVVPCATTPAPASDTDADSDWRGSQFGPWFVSDIRQGTDAGETTAIAGTEAHLGTADTGQAYLLAVRCNDGAVDLSVGWFDAIDANPPMVEVVTGSGTTLRGPWSRSTDQESTFYPSHLVESFIRSLYGETSLIVRMEVDGEAPLAAVFDIERVEEALANVWSACDS